MDRSRIDMDEAIRSSNGAIVQSVPKMGQSGIDRVVALIWHVLQRIALEEPHSKQSSTPHRIDYDL